MSNNSDYICQISAGHAVCLYKYEERLLWKKVTGTSIFDFHMYSSGNALEITGTVLCIFEGVKKT